MSRENNIVEIDDLRPHINIYPLDKSIHIIPVAFFEKVVEGKIAFTELEDYEILIPIILQEWLMDRGVYDDIYD